MTTPDPVAAIEVTDLQYRFDAQGPWVLDLPALRIERGEKVLLLGPSGCGKSTLLGLLAGVHRASAGQLLVLGQSLTGLRPAQRDRFRADHIGFVFQLFNLLPYLDLVDNVLLPCRFSARRASQALRRDGSLVRHAQRLLDALELPLGLRRRTVTDLSVGQQQRVAVARALAGAPELLICDEPTSALDHVARDGFLKLLFAQCAQTAGTLLLVSHDPGLSHGFDRVLTLPALDRRQLPATMAAAAA